MEANSLGLTCTTCGTKLDASTPAEAGADYKPIPGDFSVCFSCGAINRFDENLHLAPVTEQEIAELDPENREYLFKVQRKVREYLAARKQAARQPPPRRPFRN